MRVSRTRPFAKLAATAALAGTIGLSGGAALAQEVATPATPIGPAACVAPATGAVTASPVADAMASPVAGDAELPEGTVVEDEAVIAEATAAIENQYACLNEGQGEALVSLFTANGLSATFGPWDPAEIAAHITAKSTFVQAEPVVVNEVLDFGDGTYGVDYQVKVGQQVYHRLDVLTNVDGTWLVDNRVVEMPETDLDSTTGSVKTSVADGAIVFEVSPSPLANQPAVKLQFTNNGDSAQHVVLFQGGDAASVTSADLTALPEGVTFVGEVTVPAGEIVDSLFEELPEGNYVLVVETENGETGSFDLTIDPPFDPNA